MAPSDKVLSEAIRNAVRRMFKGPDRDNLTVNKIRDQVETELHLDPGFLKQGSWKQESKNIVKTESDKLLQLEEAGEDLPSVPLTPAKVKSTTPKKSATEPVKKGVKRSSNGDKAQALKRQKKEATTISKGEDEDSALTSIEDTPEEAEDSYHSDALEPEALKKSAVKPLTKGLGKQKVDKGKERGKQKRDIAKETHVPDFKSSSKKAHTKESVQEDDSDAPAQKELRDDDMKRGTFMMGGDEEEVHSDSEMSVVLDEAPKRKKKSSSISKGRPSLSTSKSSKPVKLNKPPPDLPPDEAELKTLQSQLAMCGVRKIWGVVLKDHGSDTKAKIRHLKGMLKDIGMGGRFSKQKAEEIKEARELQADLEAVKEGEAIWGMASGARSKKASGGKKKVELSDEEEENEVEVRSGSASENPPARLARAKMDLAFLGDESESDD